MSNQFEPFDPDIQALLNHAKPVAVLTTAELTRLHDKVAARLAIPVAGGGGSGASGNSGALSLGKAAGLATIFALGVASGVVLDRTALRAPAAVPPASTTTVTTVASTALPAHDDSPWTPVEVPSASATAPATPAPRASTSNGTISARGLDAERSLLDVARSALAHGEPDEALAATHRHAREYPRGALLEEREALTIKALVAAGRVDEARKRAAEFEQRFPNGLMLRAVRAAVGTTP